jgi:hypothetical protein
MTKEDDISDIQSLADSLVATGSPFAYMILDCVDTIKAGVDNENKRYCRSVA